MEALYKDGWYLINYSLRMDIKEEVTVSCPVCGTVISTNGLRNVIHSTIYCVSEGCYAVFDFEPEDYIMLDSYASEVLKKAFKEAEEN